MLVRTLRKIDANQSELFRRWDEVNTRLSTIEGRCAERAKVGKN
jgi:hypothetical protein